MLKKLIYSIALSSALMTSTMGAGIISVAADVEQTTATGMAYLQIDQGIKLNGSDVYADGQYDMTWEMPASVSVQGAQFIRLVIKHNDYGAFGRLGDVSLSIDELWLDGIKVEDPLNGQSEYSYATDGAYGENGVTSMSYPLRNNISNDISADVQQSIRIVFTLSNITDPNAGSVETTINSTEEETITETEIITTTATNNLETTTNVATSTTVNKQQNPSSPNTADNGFVVMYVILMFVSGVTVCIFRKNEKK